MPNDLRDWTSAAGAPQRGLATFSAPPNATTPQTVTISRGTHSVAVLLNSLTNVNVISVTGVTTGVVYAANLINLTAFGTLFFVPVLSDFDNQITVAVTMGIGAQTATVRVAEILDPEIVAIFQSNTLVVQGTGISASVNTDPIDRAGRLLGITDVSDRFARAVGRVGIRDGTGGGADALVDGSNALRVQEGANPPLWQAPRARAESQTNVNGNTTVVASVAGQNIFVFSWELSLDGSQNGALAFLQDGAGNHFAELSLNGAANAMGSLVGWAGGLPMGVAGSVILNATSIPAGSRLIGIVHYSQG